MNPEEAYLKAKEIVNNASGKTGHYAGHYFPDDGHAPLDALLCTILRELGYGKLIDFYESLDRWFE